MKILVATADTDLARVLPLVLGPDGHQLSLHQALASANVALGNFAADVVLVDRELPDGSGLELVEAASRSGRVLRALVMTRVSPNKDAALRAALESPAVEWVRRPFDVLDLAGRLREGAATSPLTSQTTDSVDGGAGAVSSTPSQGRPAEARHLRPAMEVVCEVWRKKQTGAIFCELPGGAAPVAMVVNGGHIDAGGLEALRIAVVTGQAAFKETAVEGTGDARALGQVLWAAALQAARPDFLVARRFLALNLVGDQNATRWLPVGVHTAKLLETAAPDLKVGDLLSAARVPTEDVSAELAALSMLGLVRFSSPRREPVVPTPRPAAAPRPPLGRGAQDQELNGPTAAQRTVLLRKRFRRELEVLRGEGTPFAVLGLAAGASLEMLEAAHQRMRPRYSEVIEEQQLPQDVRDMAEALLEMVDEAWQTIQEKGVAAVRREARPASPPPKVEPPSEETVAIEAGLSAAQAEDWKRADAAFTRAHNLRIDNALTLAWLGWARFHNDSVELELRTEEARDFLLLAEQFDPTQTMGQMFLARLLIASDEPGSAALRLKRVLRLEEDNAEARELLDSIVLEEDED